MKLKKSLFVVLFAFLLTIVGCSGEKAKDFRVSNWGDTVDQVIAAEEQNGNENPETDVDSNETTVTYSDIVISGQLGDAEYTFVNERDKPSLGEYAYYNGGEKISKSYSKEISESRKDELNKEYDELLEKLKEEYDALPDTYVFDDYRLESADYDFYDLTEEASKKLLEELTDKYGEPERKTNDIISWRKGDTQISCYYSTTHTSITYSANFQVMSKFSKLNKSKGTNSDL